MVSPIAGQVLRGNSTVPIAWVASDDEALQAFHFQASDDGGHTWHFIAEDLPPTANSFAWQLPSTSEIPNVRLRVIAVDQRFQSTSSGGDRPLSNTEPLPVPHKRRAIGPGRKPKVP